jgi:hypothetical protein
MVTSCSTSSLSDVLLQPKTRLTNFQATVIPSSNESQPSLRNREGKEESSSSEVEEVVQVPVPVAVSVSECVVSVSECISAVVADPSSDSSNSIRRGGPLPLDFLDSDLADGMMVVGDVMG